jgi:hypothetical protein
VELHGELAERAFQFLVIGAFLHTERFVKISFHGRSRHIFLAAIVADALAKPI